MVLHTSHSRPADVLVQNWVGGKPAAFDFTITSPLTPKFWDNQIPIPVLLLRWQKSANIVATMPSVLSLVGVVFL